MNFFTYIFEKNPQTPNTKHHIGRRVVPRSRTDRHTDVEAHMTKLIGAFLLQFFEKRLKRLKLMQINTTKGR